MRIWIRLLLFVAFGASAQAQAPQMPASWTFGMWTPGLVPSALPEVGPFRSLMILRANATCNQPDPGPALPTAFVLTVEPLTTAKIAWWDPAFPDPPSPQARWCTYDLFAWLNSIKGPLAPGLYQWSIQATATDGVKSLWGQPATPTSFLKPAVVPTPLPPAVPKGLKLLGSS